MRPALETQRVAGGAEDEPRLVGPGDDATGKPGLAPQAPHERGAVAGLADGARRDRARAA